MSESCEVLGAPPFHSVPKLRRCGYCNIIQPLRAKHCEDCNRCVHRYDHHCPWLGNCVGERNHRFFWAFLLFEASLIGWSAEIGWYDASLILLKDIDNEKRNIVFSELALKTV